MTEIRGVLTAMATAFRADGSVDLAGTRRLAANLVDEQGSHGVVVAGTTGEASTLNDAEHIGLLGAIAEEIGDRATVICGTGTNDTRHSVELTKAAAEAGADAALVVTPYYNKPNRAGILRHFETVAGAVPGLPIVAYNIPSRVVVNMPPELLAELAKIDDVVAVKQANNDDLGPIEGLALLAGNDEVFLRTLELGGAGGILVGSQLVGPAVREIWDAAGAGEMDRAWEIDATLRPLYAALGDTNPIPVKAGLEMMGLIDSAHMRLPLVEADERQTEAVRDGLAAAGVRMGS